MELIGNIKNISQSFLTGDAEVTFAVERREALCLEGLKDKKLRIEVKEYKAKRSLTANGYYWVLIAKLAGVLNVSNARLHNMMLRRYGQPYVIAGDLMRATIPDTDEAENMILEDEFEHLKPTSQVIQYKDGVARRTYVVMRGSSDYDTAEFSRLIGGLVSECEEVGIETLPPRELAKMLLLRDKE